MATTAAGQIAPVQQALADVRQMLGLNIKTIDALLGRYMPKERFCGAVLTLCRHNPDLLDISKADRQSLLLATLRIAQLQLSPDPALGQAWIIPRKGKAEFQLGWKGCLALAYRSPLVAAVRYNVVGPRDHFVWRDGRNWTLDHEPSEEGWPAKLDEVRAAWAIIELRSGSPIPRVMYLPEIIRHKQRGQGSQPAWVTDGAAMALKTVIADACRRGPFEGEIGRAFVLDHQGETGLGQPEDGAIDVPYTVGDQGNGSGNGNGHGKPATAADRFKAAHSEEAAEPTDEHGDFDISQAVPLMDEAAQRRVLEAGRARGMGDNDVLELAGGPLDVIPAAEEMNLLRQISTWKAPKGKK